MSKTPPIVLLASADDSARQASARMLSQIGLHAEHARSGEQALEKADGLVPDAVVAHSTLPDMDGLVLRERLRANPSTRRVPLLIVSGSEQTWFHAVELVSRLVWLRQAPYFPLPPSQMN